MILTILRDWEVYDAAAGGKPKKQMLPAGSHRVELIDNPLGHPKAPWLVLEGTKIGATEASWRQWEGKDYGEDEVIIEED